ncbi:MAG: DUF2933 domain-containing protein [bacterium]
MQTQRQETPQRRTILGFCLNWKVIGGLALVAVGLWVFAPSLVARALPLLLFAACPLSMLFMMRGMKGESQTGSQSGASCHTPGQAEPVRRTETPITLADKKAELASLQARQEILSREIAQVQNGNGKATPEKIERWRPDPGVNSRLAWGSNDHPMRQG